MSRVVRANLTAIGYRRPDRPVARDDEAGIRDRWTDASTTVTITQQTRFRVALPYSAFGLAIASDWRRGLVRIRQHDSAVQLMLSSASCASAWTLVSAYYTCFFSAVEILRVGGVFPVFLNNEDVGRLRSASTTAVALETGQYLGVSRLDEVTRSVEIHYVKQARAVHEITWAELRRLIERDGGGSEPALPLLLAIVNDEVEDRWMPPNAVRNEWNYRAVERYGPEGEALAREARKLLPAADSAMRWLEQRRVRDASIENMASGIAVLRHLLRQNTDALAPLFAPD